MKKSFFMVLSFLAVVVCFQLFNIVQAQDMSVIPSEYDKGVVLKKVLGKDKPVVVVFYTDWCGACKRVVPVFDAVRDELSDKAEFVMVNADKETELSDKYDIRYYPTVFFIDTDGKKTEIKQDKYFYDTFKANVEKQLN